MDINNLRKHAKMHRLKAYYDEYRKATKGMDPTDHAAYIDQHVMHHIHQAVHSIEDYARSHVGGQAQIVKAKKEIHNMLASLVEKYKNFKISDPENNPHVFHLADNHVDVPAVLQAIIKHKITIDEGVKKIIAAELEEEHDRHSVESKKFKKCISYDFKKGIDRLSNLGITGNALSMYRPSPPLMVDVFKTPDFEFIKLLMKQKLTMLEKHRTNEPKYNIKEVVEQLGVPEWRPADEKENK